MIPGKQPNITLAVYAHTMQNHKVELSIFLEKSCDSHHPQKELSSTHLQYNFKNKMSESRDILGNMAWGAAQTGDMGKMRAAENQGADLDWMSVFGISVVSIAAFHGHLDIVRYLIDSGVDLDSPCTLGWTPLHNAAAGGRTEIALMLLEAEVDHTVLTGRNVTAKQLAESRDYHATASAIASFVSQHK